MSSKADLYTIWQQLDAAGLASANLDLISDIIACPGLDYCSLANARSIPVAQKISERFADTWTEKQRELGELKLKISGCINACGHHHAGHIGILGVDKRGSKTYQLCSAGARRRIPHRRKITGPGFSEDGIVDAVEKATECLSGAAQPKASASSIPTAALAWPRSRRRFMGDLLRYRDDAST